MIEDKHIAVTYTDENGQGQITITVTGEQIGQTVRRRMNTLMPKARIQDITEKKGELELRPGKNK